LIAAGEVLVDGQAELRRGRKLREGQVVTLGSQRIQVMRP
jgi:ribosome-associated protein YbcJ (S4-like RNA binding protein)